MLYLKNGEWDLCAYKVNYKQHGETLEQYTNDKQWWVDFAAKWDHTEIIAIDEVSYSDEQEERLEEVKNIDEGFEYYASRYVLEGLYPNELEEGERLNDHPMQLLQLRKENVQQGQTLTDADIENKMQGQLMTEVDLRLRSLEVSK